MSDYGFKPGNANLRTDMEAGLARVRRRFLTVPTEMQVSWELTMNELGIFEKFYDTDTFNGSAWFNIKLVNGTGEKTYSARFKEPYAVKTSAREYMWMVNATLEVLARPLPV
jgi:hypothetical protein